VFTRVSVAGTDYEAREFCTDGMGTWCLSMGGTYLGGEYVFLMSAVVMPRVCESKKPVCAVAHTW
jgi:hypothetical protein